MAVYRTKNAGKPSRFYTCDFIYQGKRFKESTGCATKTAAREYEKDLRKRLELAHAGIPSESRSKRISTVSETTQAYLDGYKVNHRESSTDYVAKRIKHVNRILGTMLLPDLTEDLIRQYIGTRKKEKASGRTINMELGELSRAMGHTWSRLWPKVRKLEERKDIGQAFTPEGQNGILDAAAMLRSPVVRGIIPTLLLTGMRAGEAMSLRWRQVDLFQRTITLGKAKTSSGTGRVIPINDDLLRVLIEHRQWFVATFGEPRPERCVFPFGSPQPKDPNRPVTDISSGWELCRKTAGVRCRLHDLRHTFATRLAENGVPESTMLALMGHMSRAMLERYSHIRMAAKRQAVAGVSLRQQTPVSEGAPLKVPLVEPPASVN